jgi:hypothetical protein
MSAAADQLPVGIEACDCLTPLGNAQETTAALLEGKRALALTPVLGRDGGDPVPLALLGPMNETVPPRWLASAICKASLRFPLSSLVTPLWRIAAMNLTD